MATRGYNGFSYADISEAVRISKASIHHHFPSTVELVQTVLRRYREQGREGLAGLPRMIPDPLERLRAYTGYWESCIRDGTAPFCICAMLGSELPALPQLVAEEVRAHFVDLTAWLTVVLEQGAAKGTFQLRTERHLGSDGPYGDRARRHAGSACPWRPGGICHSRPTGREAAVGT